MLLISWGGGCDAGAPRTLLDRRSEALVYDRVTFLAGVGAVKVDVSNVDVGLTLLDRSREELDLGSVTCFSDIMAVWGGIFDAGAKSVLSARRRKEELGCDRGSCFINMLEVRGCT